MKPERLDRIKARPTLPPLEPRFSPSVARVVRWLAPAYRRYSMRIERYEVEGGRGLAELVSSFQQGRCRFAVTFKHPNAMDPQCVYYLFSNRLRRIAREAGIRFAEPPHVSFLYGRGVPLWAGSAVGWLLPRIGAMPVMQGANDAVGLRRIRDAVARGRFPLALAPEGQVTYHTHRVDRVETGAARFALWCAEDIESAGSRSGVCLVPVAPIYRYSGDPRRHLDHVLSDTVRLMGGSYARIGNREEALSALIETASGLLERIEGHYVSQYGYLPHDSLSHRSAAEETTARFRDLADFVINFIERYYVLPALDSADGSLVSRLYPPRHAGWSRVFRDDFDRVESSSLDRALADRSAAEAYLISRHLELVDALAYLDLTYAEEAEGFDRMIEVALNLYDVASRCLGNTIAGRLSLPCRVTMRVGEAIPVSAYRADATARRASKQAAEELSAAVRRSLQALSW